MSNGTTKKPFAIYSVTVPVGSINATSAKVVDISSYIDKTKYDFIWIGGLQPSDRVGILSQIHRDDPNNAFELWVYNTRNATAANVSVDIYYTLN